MKTMTITTINGTPITISEGDNGTLVPIKPICEALGIAFQSQHEKIKNDPDLAPTVTLSITVGADQKSREMVCLPLEYIFGWMFTINPANVKPEAQEAVRAYRRECYHALYSHFFEKSEQNQAREKSLERTILLQNEHAALKAKPEKTGEDFDRYLQIEGELFHEMAVRKSLTKQYIKTLFD